MKLKYVLPKKKNRAKFLGLPTDTYKDLGYNQALEEISEIDIRLSEEKVGEIIRESIMYLKQKGALSITSVSLNVMAREYIAKALIKEFDLGGLLSESQ